MEPNYPVFTRCLMSGACQVWYPVGKLHNANKQGKANIKSVNASCVLYLETSLQVIEATP